MFDDAWSILRCFWYAVSVTVAGFALWRHIVGRAPFTPPRFRRNQVMASDLLMLVGIYLMVNGLALALLGSRPEDDPQRLFWTYTFHAISQVMIVTAALGWAWFRFDKQLAGFGLTGVAPGRLVGPTLLAFVVITGVTSLVLLVTVTVCESMGYQVQRHEVLEALRDHPPMTLLVLLIVSPALLAPLAEEMMFRGLFLNYFAGMFCRLEYRLARPGTDPPALPCNRHRWGGIVLSSLVWAVLFHPQWQHWPALLVLGIGLGYVYERRRSLLVPIAIHCLFNMLSLSLTLTEIVS